MKKNFILMFLYSFFFIYNVKSMIVEGKINKKKIIFKINPTDKLDSRIFSDFLKTIAFKNLLEISNIEYFAKHIKPLIIKDEKEEKEKQSNSEFIELLKIIIKKNKENKQNNKNINNQLKKINKENKEKIYQENEMKEEEEEEEEFFDCQEYSISNIEESIKKIERKISLATSQFIQNDGKIDELEEEKIKNACANIMRLLNCYNTIKNEIIENKKARKNSFAENLLGIRPIIEKLEKLLENIENGDLLKKNIPELHSLLRAYTNVGEAATTLLDPDSIKEIINYGLNQLDEKLEKHSNPLIKRIDRAFDYLTIQNTVFGFSILSCLYYIIKYLNQEKIDDKYLFDWKWLGKRIGIFSLLPSLALLMGQFITNLNGTILDLIQYNFVFIEYQKQNGSGWEKELLTHTLSFDTMSLLTVITLIIFNKQLNENFYYINYFFSIYILHHIYFYLNENTSLKEKCTKFFHTYSKICMCIIPYLCIVILVWRKNKNDIDTFFTNFTSNKLYSIKVILWNQILKWFFPGVVIGTGAPIGLIKIFNIFKKKFNAIYIEKIKNINNTNIFNNYNLNDGLDAIQKINKNNNQSMIMLPNKKEMTKNELIKEITSNFEVFIQIENYPEYQWNNEDDYKYTKILKYQAKLIASKNKLNNNKVLCTKDTEELKKSIDKLEEKIKEEEEKIKELEEEERREKRELIISTFKKNLS